ncbi:MAG: VWA domain-containing protein [Lewinellaceae bacterium]|nr:VWA domain-containing protein [Lewinellaceae bacterium]
MVLSWTIRNVELMHPWMLLLLLLLPLFWVLFQRQRRQRYTPLQLSSLAELQAVNTWRSRLRPWLPLLRVLAYCLIVIALARPRIPLQEEEIKAEGIDIMMVMDLSSSMLAQDFQPDRLEVSKRVAAEFIDKRPYDRIGLVVFAGEAFTQCPLTTDHRVLQDFLSQLSCGVLEDGTAIGMGLGTALNRIKDSEATSKVVILLTDGVNNAGYLKPITAAEIAREFSVRVYTIGVGSTGDALTPVSRRSDGRYTFGLARVEIDETLLENIAQMTGGRYFRATSAEGLKSIYEEIDTLEKTEIEVTVVRRYSEVFYAWLGAALVLLFLEVLLRFSIFRSIP